MIRKGEEITISYVPPYLDLTTRRATLREGWYFDCNCTRCSDPKELGAMTSAVKCVDCTDSQQAFLLPNDSLDKDAPWQCSTCSGLTKSNDIAHRLASIRRKVDHQVYIHTMFNYNSLNLKLPPIKMNANSSQTRTRLKIIFATVTLVSR